MVNANPGGKKNKQIDLLKREVIMAGKEAKVRCQTFLIQFFTKEVFKLLYREAQNEPNNLEFHRRLF